MIKTSAFALLFILLLGCGRTGVVSVPFLEPKPYNIGKRDIIKFYKEEKLFYDSCKVYLEEIDTSQISYWDRGIKLKKSKPGDYKIYEDMIDWFDLEKTDQHKYKSPELFFADEFNKNFIKGFRYGDDRYLNIYYYSGLITIKEGMIEEFEEVGKAFNSDF